MTAMTETSKSALVRIWPHGDETVARITVSGGDQSPTESILLPDRRSIIEWMSEWVSNANGDASVT